MLYSPGERGQRGRKCGEPWAELAVLAVDCLSPSRVFPLRIQDQQLSSRSETVRPGPDGREVETAGGDWQPRKPIIAASERWTRPGVGRASRCSPGGRANGSRGTVGARGGAMGLVDL